MPASDTVTVETIRQAVEYLRAHVDPSYAAGSYFMPIDPSWLATPERRGQLWELMEHLAALDADA